MLFVNLTVTCSLPCRSRSFTRTFLRSLLPLLCCLDVSCFIAAHWRVLRFPVTDCWCHFRVAWEQTLEGVLLCRLFVRPLGHVSARRTCVIPLVGGLDGHRGPPAGAVRFSLAPGTAHRWGCKGGGIEVPAAQLDLSLPALLGSSHSWRSVVRCVRAKGGYGVLENGPLRPSAMAFFAPGASWGWSLPCLK